MKIQVLSDIHVEFYSQGKANKLLRSLVNPEAEAVIIAGDFGVSQSSRYTKHLRLVCELWPEVYFVTGNHDYWNAMPGVVETKLATVSKDCKNFHWLNGNWSYLGDYTIFGLTLWFKPAREYTTWCDYLSIPDGPNFIELQEVSKRLDLMEYLSNDKISSKRIIVSHHMPSYLSIDPRYATWDTNKFFVNDVEDLIKWHQPTIWIHGHTHSSLDYMIGSTRILCNPLGYPRLEGPENPNFNKDLLIEV